ncbi:MAG: glycosyltransferase family 39 protein [candidate division WOR-3 bacterium]
MKKLYIVYIVILIFFTANIINLKNLSLIDWDEGVFALQAKWFASMGMEGKPFNFQTPPLFQIIIALAFKIFGYKAEILPLISIIFSCLSIYIVFIFSREIYNETIGLIGVFLFISTEYFLFFSKSGLSDATFLFFFLTAIYFFYRTIEDENKSSFILCGLFTLLACYTKYTGPILFLIYLIINFTIFKIRTKYFYLFTIVIPILLLLPYFIIFIKVISVKGIFSRHGSLLGVHHLKFLYYLIRFAPMVFLSAIFYRMRDKNDYFILVIILTFFIILGFYYPYLRLAYPLIPFFTLFSACFIYKFKKLRTYICVIIFLINIFLGYDTIIYHSNIPRLISQKVDTLCESYKINYVITATPPNILFNISGDIILTDNQMPRDMKINKFTGAERRKIIKKEDNLIKDEKHILFLNSNIFPTINEQLMPFKKKAKSIESIEFIDAPIYYKDIFNELRTQKQIYELIVFEKPKFNYNEMDSLWQLCFEPGVAIVKR